VTFLLDTSICIHALKQDQTVLGRLLAEKPIDVGLSVITEAELGMACWGMLVVGLGGA
jgi:predicted nucleic acid-binding protein